MSVPAFLEARRSIRAFTGAAVARETLDALVEAACIAPAPHHSRPWRFVVVDTDTAKRDLATGMGDQWRTDLAADGMDPARIDELVEASHRKLLSAPALVLGCLTWDGLDRYPDPTRQRAEWGMALLSLGAAVENLMVAAADAALASCWVAAPIFCPEAARRASRPRVRRSAPPRDPAGAAPRVPLGAGRASARSRVGPGTTPRCAPRPCRDRSRASSRGGSRRDPGRAQNAAAHLGERARGSARP
jgi:F420 biosynthesis protein FbiB-like protein